MSHSYGKHPLRLLLLPLSLVLSACGSDGKWLEAPNALNLAQLGAQAQALSSNSGSAGDTSCEAMLPHIESAVKEANPQNFIFQAAIAPCSKAGMELGEELRCTSGRLQVLCR